MKKSYLFILAFSSALLFSCGNDDDPGNPAEELENEQNEAENTELDVNSDLIGLTIFNSSTEEGELPSASGDITFELLSNEQTALLNTGLEITLTSDDELDGAYIKLKNVDGTASNNYFNVPFEGYYGGRVYMKKQSKKKLHKTGAKMASEFEYTIYVSFDETVEPGQFCYDISVYNEEDGSVSLEQSVCVTIEAWGGNQSIVGEWVVDHRDPDTQEDHYYESCDGGEVTIYRGEGTVTDEYSLILESDGSYAEVYFSEFYELDFSKTWQTCEAVYQEDMMTDDEQYNGKWAFDQSKGLLYIVDFEFVDQINPENNETYQPGSVYMYGVSAEIINDQLVLSEKEGDDEYKIYYNRK